MSQAPLFVENIYDALTAIVAHLGGPKSVGAMFWPAKPTEDAGKLLRDCLNPNRNEKLDPDQIVMLFRLAREHDFHIAKHWLDDETGYVRSLPSNPKDEEARLVAVLESTAQTMERALTELGKVRARKPTTLTKVA